MMIGGLNMYEENTNTLESDTSVIQSKENGTQTNNSISDDDIGKIADELYNKLLLNSKTESEEDLEEIEDSTEGTLTNDSWSFIDFLDESVDHHLYLSSEVQDASIDDVYSMLLSTRNIILLFFLVLLLWQSFRVLKSAFYKVFNL